MDEEKLEKKQDGNISQEDMESVAGGDWHEDSNKAVNNMVGETFGTHPDRIIGI